MSFLFGWLKQESVQSPISVKDSLDEDDKKKLNNLEMFLSEDEEYEETGIKIIRLKINQLFQNFPDKYPNDSQMQEKMASHLAEYEAKHQFLSELLKPYKSAEMEENKFPLEEEEEKSSEILEAANNDPDIQKFQDIQQSLLSAKISAQAKGINELKQLIQTRPDLAYLLIESNKEVLASLDALENFQGEPLLIYPQYFTNLEYKTNSTALSLLKSIESVGHQSQKQMLLKELKMVAYQFYAAYKIIQNEKDYIACPHSIEKALKNVLECFQISDRYTLDNLISFHQLSSKDAWTQLGQQFAQSFPKQNSFSILLPIFFHLLKRCEDWNSVVKILNQNLSNYPEKYSREYFQFNQKLCFMFLFLHSELILQIRCLQLYSQFNPVPLLYRKLHAPTEFDVNDKIYYCLDPSEGVLSFGLGRLSQYKCGKSSLLNQVFQTNFETQDYNVLSFGTIDINFDHNFVPSRKISVADGNGILEKKYLELFASYFNTLILHVNPSEVKRGYDLPNHVDINLNAQISASNSQIVPLFELLSSVVKQNKNIILLIRDTDTQHLKNGLLTELSQIRALFPEIQNLESLSQKHGSFLTVVCIKNLDEGSKEEKELIHSEIRRIIYQSIFRKDGQNLCETRIMGEPQSIPKVDNISHQSFAEFLYQFNQNSDVIKVHETSKNFIQQLLAFQDDFYSKEAFPSRMLMKTLRNCENDLKNANISESKMQMSEKLKKETEIALQNLQLTDCVKRFMEILNLEQSMVALIEIARVLKLQVEQNISDLHHQKTQLYQLNKDTKDSKIDAQIESINLQIDKQRLSIEHIWREVFYMYEYNSNSFLNYSISPKECMRNSVLAGEPFEIIDGDNLYFSKDIIADILGTQKLNKQKVLIISILGPQSSGKSTLLNYMFGCLFATSAGRCTKGIYGSIITLKDHKHYDCILIIDSEGLLSSEKNDSEFDRKITCFALAVSHIVLINVKGDLHQPMQNLLEICTLNLHELNKEKIEMPLVYFVFNQNTDLEKTKFMSQIDCIYKNIINANELATDSAQIFQPDQNLIKPLPLAYKLERIEKSAVQGIPHDWDYKEPSSNFSNACSTFCTEIMNEVEKRNQSLKILTPRLFSEWLQLNSNIWETIEKYPDLIIYSNILAMKQDKKLKQIVADLEKVFLSECFQNHKQYQNEKFQEKKQEIDSIQKIQNLGGAVWEKVMHDLEKSMQDYYSSIRQQLENELEAIHNKENFDPLLYKNHKLFLVHRVDMFYQESILELNRNILQVRFDKTSKSGLYDLREQLIEQVRHDLEQGCEPQEDSFQKTWKNFIEKQIQDVNLEKNSKSLFDKILGLYRKKTLALPSNPQIRQELQKVLSLKTEELSPTPLLTLEDDFLANYFTQEFKVQTKFLQASKTPPVFNQIPKNIQTNRHSYINARDFLDTKFYFIVYQIDQLISYLGSNILRKIMETILKLTESARNYSFRDELKAKNQLKREIFEFLNEFGQVGIQISQDARNELDAIITHNTFRCDFSPLASIKSKLNDYFKRLTFKNPSDVEKVLLPNKNLIPNFELQTLKKKLVELGKYQEQYHYQYFFADYIFYKKEDADKTRNDIDKAENLQIYITNIMYYYEPKMEFQEFSHLFQWIQFPQKNFIIQKINSQSAYLCKIYTRWDVFFKELAIQLKNQISIDQNMLEDENWKNISSLCVSIIDNSYQKIIQMIDNLTYELAQFAQTLEMTAETSIHLYSIYIIYKILGTAQQQRLLSPIRQLDGRKDEWYNIYLSLTAYNPVSLSTAVAKGICANFEARCNYELTNMIKEQSVQCLKKNEKKFTVENFVQELDDYYFNKTNSIEDIINYILNQYDCYEKNFTFLWKNMKANIDSIVEQEKTFILNIIDDFIGFLQTLKQFFIDHDLINVDSVQLFEGSQSIDIEMQARQEAAYKFLGHLVQKIPVENIEYMSGDLVITNAKQYLVLTFAHTKVVKALHDLVISSYFEVENKQIGNFKVFIDVMLTNLDEIKAKIQAKIFTEVELDIDSTMQDLKKRSLGCSKLCPCCGRKCEQVNADHQDEHQIYQGHQIQGMKGIRYEGSQVAVTLSCDEREPQDECKLEGQRLTWLQYLQKYMKDWTMDFDQNKDVKIKNIEKFRNIWKQLGPSICSFYKSKHDIAIEYQSKITANSQKHFILVLDDSGSMAGAGWNNAVRGARSFLATGQSKFATDTVSLVQFSNSVHVACMDQPINEHLYQLMKYRDGGTNFSIALRQCHELMKKVNTCDIHIIIFYTDGESWYPDQEVAELKQSKLQFKFFGICQGSGTSAFGQMTQNLGGQLVEQVTPDMLEVHLVTVLNSFNK